MRRVEMPVGSARQSSGRRQNVELDPFPVEQISGSPIMRGRRQNSEDEQFPVENIPRSPVMRGRKQNSEDRFFVEDMPRSPVMRGRRQNSDEERVPVEETPGSSVARSGRERVPRGAGTARSANMDEASVALLNAIPNAPGWNLESDTTDNSIRYTMASTSSGTVNVAIPRAPESPDHDDAPPSYESSVPPNHIGWAPDVTTAVPFPMPYRSDDDHGRLITKTFSYPSSTIYPPSNTYPASHDSSKSLVRSISPSLSPSPDRLLRPAYSYQQSAARVVRTPTRPRFAPVPVDESGRFSDKQKHNEFSYRYGAIIIAAFFLTFMMILSLGVKFLIGRGAQR